MIHRNLKLKLGIILVFLVNTVFTSTAFAQFDTGQMSGFVRDKKEAAIPGATVMVANTATKANRSTMTDENGYYTFTNLRPGSYEISVEMTGFKRFLQFDIDVDANSKVRADAELERGEVVETVTVIADRTIQRDTAQIAKTVESRDIQDLAVNGRNPINLVLLAPGVRGGPFNSFNPDDVGAIGFSINGSRLEENFVTIATVIEELAAGIG